MPVRRVNWLPGIFNDFFGNEWVERQRTANPAVNILENDKEYKVEIAAPGLTKNDFRVEMVNDDTLTISVEKKTETQDNNKSHKYLRREFSYSSFRQSMVLPDDVDREKINATMEDGVLNICIPKLVKVEEPASTRLIEIN